MSDFLISIGFINKGGHIEREGESYSPAEFGGIVPSVGDRILDPGVAMLHRGEKPNFDDPARRTFWLVEERIFRPDMPGCILVCRDDQATDRHVNIL
jgi:hypothetical protein